MSMANLLAAAILAHFNTLKKKDENGKDIDPIPLTEFYDSAMA
jgi:hypothetical protein